MKIPAHILEALLLARGEDARPFTKALWVTTEHVLVTDGYRMHLWRHGQEWSHGDTPVPLKVVQDAVHVGGEVLYIGPRTLDWMPPSLASTPVQPGSRFWPYLPVMGATLPAVERYLPALPAVPTQGEQHARIRGKYLEDAQEAVRLVTNSPEHSEALHMTDSGCWTWCNGEFLVCVAPLKETDCQLKGFEK